MLKKLKHKILLSLFLTMGICSSLGVYFHHNINMQTAGHKENALAAETVIKSVHESRKSKPRNEIAKFSVSESDTEKVTSCSEPKNNQSYSYSECTKDLFTTANLFVRDSPSVSGTVLGSLLYGQGIHIIGQCNETGWYKIDYKGLPGYVSNIYVSESKPQNTFLVSKSDTRNENVTDDIKGSVSENSTPVKYTWNSNGSTQADIDRGNLILYRSNYWAADIVTSVGKQIYSLRKGDIVLIDGLKVQIDGEVHSNYWVDYVEDTREKITAQGGSYDSPAFQTCEPHSCGPIVIKYGHKI